MFGINFHCLCAGDLLDACLDGECPSAKVSHVLSHLAKCKRCATEFNQTKLLAEQLSNMPRHKMLRDLTYKDWTPIIEEIQAQECERKTGSKYNPFTGTSLASFILRMEKNQKSAIFNAFS